MRAAAVFLGVVPFQLDESAFDRLGSILSNQLEYVHVTLFPVLARTGYMIRHVCGLCHLGRPSFCFRPIRAAYLPVTKPLSNITTSTSTTNDDTRMSAGIHLPVNCNGGHKDGDAPRARAVSGCSAQDSGFRSTFFQLLFRAASEGGVQ